MIDIRDVITLSDNNKYGVASKAEKDNTVYYYLVDINDISNIKFCYEVISDSKLELVEVEDKQLIKKLILLFAKNIKMSFGMDN